MVSVQEFSSLVSGIYAAALTPQRWEGSLRDIHTVLGGISGALCRPTGAVWTIEDSNLPACAARSYAEHYNSLDHVMDAVRTGAVGVVRTGSELIQPFRAGEFYCDWMAPNRLEDGLFVRLTRDREPVCVVVASPRRTDAFATADRMKTMTALVPHLQQAVRIQDRLALATERVRHGIARVTANLHAVTLNSAAERILRDDDGLSMRAGRITAADLRVTDELRSAVCRACAGDIRSAGSFNCVRPSGKRPYIVHVVPSDRDSGHSALVLIVDSGDEPESAAAVLRRIYQLTNTEAEVAMQVMHGVELKQIAELLSISLTTVRTHLQHVFDKTDTHRQAELAHLLHSVDP
ncbi:helix-turn-helix transcriptional regulator [Mycobacterium sp. MS1601]|uniref:helix-turn-helix transcriptional regulator n=1 Tax=Mycobacterium sp. MS1601 TaxID=1936029 RepID=UPI0009794108|nr:helix-turn-helix transcriptional regulator [Mycobacterium sp. MS1601]AQA05416.1 helix-turn-helix transcriptional regulator [Mycobacterium sp. MS1601]